MPTLTRRALNRATLDRQLLLRRADLTPLQAIEHLVGLQAQTPHTWYVGLWSRLTEYRPEEVAALLTQRRAVRIALMRSTIHLVSTADALALRPHVQPALDRDLFANHTHGRSMRDLDTGEVVAAGRELLDEKPCTPSELGRLLAQRWPDRNPASLAYAVRNLLPVVQTPPRGVWGAGGRPIHAPLESWAGAPLRTDEPIDTMIVRYLAAFGPATVRDVQTWCGLTRLAEVFDRLRPRLATFHDENGAELFDLPDAPRPDPHVSAPARFLYDFDNLLLSHHDRSRVITDSFRQQNFAPHGPVPRLVLLDGFTAATWTFATAHGTATLTVHPFAPLSAPDREALTVEGGGLLDVLAPDASHEIRFTVSGRRDRHEAHQLH
ncbi:winged helix DNA-binding domain-containing protein [Streptomyces sp. ME19-01-6]|uniref:winged helix DNA-binding domain-containing protein n=1 Tax=Streptomyces sp. ME19-01-6 TaxID=3028686 RepID=UPI0029BB05D4|nr:winged helix DNA-binding domain-containing protein [Streptomyces sp. ME19-01-6]MDX3226012.1 winged helix DNA-binding domain-containing protein [Streptomyces sp. ME19-01-6]